MSANLLREAALARAREGACLLPVWWTDGSGTCACPKGSSCSSPGKHPLTLNGLDDASNDPPTITRWWTRRPKANIGERTDNLPRIDVDLLDVAEELARDTALPLDAPVVRTPRGGLHIGLATETPVESRTLYLGDGRKLGELKAARAYVLVRPSTIGDKTYQRLSPEAVPPLKVDDPVEWLRKLLPAFGFALAPDRPGSHRDYEALAGVVHEGEGRHIALTSYAGRIWLDGMAPEALVGALRAVNEAQCSPPLPDDELAGIARHFVEGREQTPVRRPASAHIAVREATACLPSTMGREEVLAVLSKWLCLPDLEAVDVLMATAIAIYLPGDPLWLYYVGPPGGTKTESLRALKGPRVVSLSSLTPQTLISGYKGDPEKVDLLPKLDGKLLVIKDFTSILSKKPEDAAAIFADLREAYDGYLEKSFGSGVGTKAYSASPCPCYPTGASSSRSSPTSGPLR